MGTKGSAIRRGGRKRYDENYDKINWGGKTVDVDVLQVEEAINILEDEYNFSNRRTICPSCGLISSYSEMDIRKCRFCNGAKSTSHTYKQDEQTK